MTENELSNIVIGCAIKVHKQLGFCGQNETQIPEIPRQSIKAAECKLYQTQAGKLDSPRFYDS